MDQITDITECCICTDTFTDPRMLPCIHTFCLRCLEATRSNSVKNTGDKMPCPICRQQFTVPQDGLSGLQKHFFMERLIEIAKISKLLKTKISCDICQENKDEACIEVPDATKYCVKCRENMCEICCVQHKRQTYSRNHQIVAFGSQVKEELVKISIDSYCKQHNKEELKLYCADCKTVICFTCFAEHHQTHKCSDVNKVADGFRGEIDLSIQKIVEGSHDGMERKRKLEVEKGKFLKELIMAEDSIKDRTAVLKKLIDKHSEILLDELNQIKATRLNETDNEYENIERHLAIFDSFNSYCTELRSKGTPVDICHSVDNLLTRADELQEMITTRKREDLTTVQVYFKSSSIEDMLKTENIVGSLKETSERLENFAVVVGFNELVMTTTNDVVKINLCRAHEISSEAQIPTRMEIEAVAAVFRNTIYVTGIGTERDEIWKYKVATGWLKCASLVQGRRRHSAAFINGIMYICGGFADSDKTVLDSVETYNAISDKCTKVGKLVHCVESAGNCVPFKSSIYIFGGRDYNFQEFTHVQVYNTREYISSVLSSSMPQPCYLMRAVLWKTTAILLGCHTCFLFNFETETWHEREQYKTDVRHFGMVLENERIFVIGGGIVEKDEYGKTICKCRNDVRYVPLWNIIDDKPIEWKIHATLPQPSLVCAYSNGQFLS